MHGRGEALIDGLLRDLRHALRAQIGRHDGGQGRPARYAATALEVRRDLPGAALVRTPMRRSVSCSTRSAPCPRLPARPPGRRGGRRRRRRALPGSPRPDSGAGAVPSRWTPLTMASSHTCASVSRRTPQVRKQRRTAVRTSRSGIVPTVRQRCPSVPGALPGLDTPSLSSTASVSPNPNAATRKPRGVPNACRSL